MLPFSLPHVINLSDNFPDVTKNWLLWIGGEVKLETFDGELLSFFFVEKIHIEIS